MAAETMRGIEAGAVTFDAPPEVQRAAGRARAVSLPSAPAQGQSATPPKVTQRDLKARATDLADAVRSGAHVTGQLPSLKGQHARVHEAAAEWEHWVLKCGRIAWGYFHLALIKAPLNVVEWSTATFPRFVITVVLGLLAWKFH